jgi:molecular chaperone GrpE
MAVADNNELEDADDSGGQANAAAQAAPQADIGARAAKPPGDVEQLRNDLAEARDRFLRAQAELENYRKRARRELDEERRYAEIHLIRDLLPIVDNVSRAIAAAEKKADADALLEGLKMMSQQFQQIFAQHHSKLITDEAIGTPFDPHRHEAIVQQPSEEHPEHTVLGVTRPGLELHDRIVRPAQVIVSKRG